MQSGTAASRASSCSPTSFRSETRRRRSSLRARDESSRDSRDGICKQGISRQLFEIGIAHRIRTTGIGELLRRIDPGCVARCLMGASPHRARGIQLLRVSPRGGRGDLALWGFAPVEVAAISSGRFISSAAACSTVVLPRRDRSGSPAHPHAPAMCARVGVPRRSVAHHATIPAPRASLRVAASSPVRRGGTALTRRSRCAAIVSHRDRESLLTTVISPQSSVPPEPLTHQLLKKLNIAPSENLLFIYILVAGMRWSVPRAQLA